MMRRIVLVGVVVALVGAGAIVLKRAARFFRAGSTPELVIAADVKNGRVAVADFGVGLKDSMLVVRDATGKEIARRAWQPRWYVTELRGDTVYFQRGAGTKDDPCELMAVEVSSEGAPRLIKRFDARVRGPRLSPDGALLAYVGPAWRKEPLRLVGASGERDLPGSKAMDDTPVWTPDGKQVVVASGEIGDQHLVVIDLASATRLELRGEGEGMMKINAVRPAVSPDGTRVAYFSWVRDASDEARADQLRVRTIDGGDTKILQKGVCVSSAPAWVDATHVVIGKYGAKGTCEAVVVDVEGGEVRGL